MKRLVIALIALIAIFTAIRAYTDTAGAPASPPGGIEIGPGLLAVSDGDVTLGLGFGLVSSEGGRRGPWSVLPVTLQLRSGDRVATLSLNGLSFLLGGGVSLGTSVVVDRPRVGDVLSAGGPVTVSSRVEGDVWALGADVTLTAKAEVTGSVVALGGRVNADPRAKVAGGIHRLAELKIPFLGALGSRYSVAAVAFARGALLFVLAALGLLLASFYLPRSLAGTAAAASGRWRESLLSIPVGAVALAVLVGLLAVSVVGILLLPFLALGVFALAGLGALALCARLGAWMRRGTAETPLALFTSGLLGLFVASLPGLAGIAAALFRGAAAATVAGALRGVSAVVALVLLAWGFGVALARLRATQAGT